MASGVHFVPGRVIWLTIALVEATGMRSCIPSR